MKQKTAKRVNSFITRIVSGLGLGSSAFVFAACYGPGPDTDSRVLAFPDHIELPAEGGETRTFSISTEGSWEVQTKEQFLMIAPNEGYDSAGIRVTALDNNTDSTRHARIIVKGRVNNDTVYVTQYAKR